MTQMKYFSSKSRRASLLRRRKYSLVRRYGVSEDILGGHLARTYRRCGKPTCHCARGQGHALWALTYSFEGKRRVESLPEDLASELAPLVDQGRRLREATMEVLAINLQLLQLWRAEQRSRRPAAQPRRRDAKHRSRQRA